MSEERIEITRQKLYERVWTTPMVHLAAEFGISDVGLAKICKKQNIPKPQAGYWSKVAAGHKVKKPQLPPTKAAGEEKIIIRRRLVSSEDAREASLPEEFARAILESQGKLASLRPDDMPSSPHPLIKWSEKGLKKASTSYMGTLELPRRGSLNIRVTEQSLDRAFAILDILFKSLECCGYELVVMENEHVATVILGEKLELRLKERVQRKETMKAKHPEVHSKSMLSYVDPGSRNVYTRKEYLYEPTGDLCIVASSPEFYVFERQLCDTKNSRIEDRLPSVIAKLIQFAGKSHLKRLDREESHRQWEVKEAERRERQLLWQEHLTLVAEERARVDGLIADAKNWRTGNIIRQYIEARRNQAFVNQESVEPDTELGKWFIWANEQADRLDPLITSPPSILDPDQ